MEKKKKKEIKSVLTELHDFYIYFLLSEEGFFTKKAVK